MLTLWKCFTVPRTVGEAVCRARPWGVVGPAGCLPSCSAFEVKLQHPHHPEPSPPVGSQRGCCGAWDSSSLGKEGDKQDFGRQSSCGVAWLSPRGQFASTLQTQVAAAFAGDAFRGWLHPGDGFLRAASKECSQNPYKLLLQTGSRALAVGCLGLLGKVRAGWQNLLPAGLQGWKAPGCEDAAGRKTTTLIHPSNVLFGLSYAVEKV